MKRKRRVHSQQKKRSYLTVREIEQRVDLLLLLLHHNFETLVQRTQARRK